MPRKRRQPKARRIEMPIGRELIDFLLTGRFGAVWQSSDNEHDAFFLSDEQLARVWREHRGELLAEAKRRGIAEPYGCQFDR